MGTSTPSSARPRALAHFGAALRLLRVDAGFSLRALAQRIGVSSAYLSRVEHGYDAVPTPDRLADIARALDLPPALLVDLGHQVEPSVSRYLERVPAAGMLLSEVARRNLSGSQIARIMAFIDTEFPAMAGGQAAACARLSAVLSPARVILKLSCKDLDGVIDAAATRLASSDGGLHAGALAEEIRRREREAPTALGGGIAVPHALVRGAPSAAVVVTLATPLSAPTPDDLPLRLVVVLLCGKEGRSHLALLAQAARLASHQGADELCAARNARQLLHDLAQMESMFG